MAGHPQFAETAALLAVMDEDDERLTELLDDMLPNEMNEFAQQLERLLRQLYARLRPITHHRQDRGENRG